MERISVSSSSIAEIGYDPETQTLEVAYIKGGIYQYYGVPSELHAEVMQSGSKGTFVNQRIKPFYACGKVG